MSVAAGRAAPRLLLIDNYDSFTYNLVQAFLVLGAEVAVHRNDEITVETALTLAPTHLCISPGPGTPAEAGVSKDMRAERLMHGKTSNVMHDRRGVFVGLQSPLKAGRYHSLIAKRDTLPGTLEVTAWTEEGEVMGVRHRSLPIEGVQFHPESILTPDGPKLLGNFLRG